MSPATSNQTQSFLSWAEAAVFSNLQLPRAGVASLTADSGNPRNSSREPKGWRLHHDHDDGDGIPSENDDVDTDTGNASLAEGFASPSEVRISVSHGHFSGASPSSPSSTPLPSRPHPERQAKPLPPPYFSRDPTTASCPFETWATRVVFSGLSRGPSHHHHNHDEDEDGSRYHGRSADRQRDDAVANGGMHGGTPRPNGGIEGENEAEGDSEMCHPHDDDVLSWSRNSMRSNGSEAESDLTVRQSFDVDVAIAECPDRKQSTGKEDATVAVAATEEAAASAAASASAAIGSDDKPPHRRRPRSFEEWAKNAVFDKLEWTRPPQRPATSQSNSSVAAAKSTERDSRAIESNAELTNTRQHDGASGTSHEIHDISSPWHRGTGDEHDTRTPDDELAKPTRRTDHETDSRGNVHPRHASTEEANRTNQPIPRISSFEEWSCHVVFRGLGEHLPRPSSSSSRDGGGIVRGRPFNGVSLSLPLGDEDGIGGKDSAANVEKVAVVEDAGISRSIGTIGTHDDDREGKDDHPSNDRNDSASISSNATLEQEHDSSDSFDGRDDASVHDVVSIQTSGDTDTDSSLPSPRRHVDAPSFVSSVDTFDGIEKDDKRCHYDYTSLATDTVEMDSIVDLDNGNVDTFYRGTHRRSIGSGDEFAQKNHGVNDKESTEFDTEMPSEKCKSSSLPQQTEREPARVPQHDPPEDTPTRASSRQRMETLELRDSGGSSKISVDPPGDRCHDSSHDRGPQHLEGQTHSSDDDGAESPDNQSRFDRNEFASYSVDPPGDKSGNDSPRRNDVDGNNGRGQRNIGLDPMTHDHEYQSKSKSNSSRDPPERESDNTSSLARRSCDRNLDKVETRVSDGVELQCHDDKVSEQLPTDIGGGDSNVISPQQPVLELKRQQATSHPDECPVDTSPSQDDEAGVGNPHVKTAPTAGSTENEVTMNGLDETTAEKLLSTETIASTHDSEKKGSEDSIPSAKAICNLILDECDEDIPPSFSQRIPTSPKRNQLQQTSSLRMPPSSEKGSSFNSTYESGIRRMMHSLDAANDSESDSDECHSGSDAIDVSARSGPSLASEASMFSLIFPHQERKQERKTVFFRHYDSFIPNHSVSSLMERGNESSLDFGAMLGRKGEVPAAADDRLGKTSDPLDFTELQCGNNDDIDGSFTLVKDSITLPVNKKKLFQSITSGLMDKSMGKFDFNMDETDDDEKDQNMETLNPVDKNLQDDYDNDNIDGSFNMRSVKDSLILPRKNKDFSHLMTLGSMQQSMGDFNFTLDETEEVDTEETNSGEISIGEHIDGSFSMRSVKDSLILPQRKKGVLDNIQALGSMHKSIGDINFNYDESVAENTEESNKVGSSGVLDTTLQECGNDNTDDPLNRCPMRESLTLKDDTVSVEKSDVDHSTNSGSDDADAIIARTIPNLSNEPTHQLNPSRAHHDGASTDETHVHNGEDTESAGVSRMSRDVRQSGVGNGVDTVQASNVNRTIADKYEATISSNSFTAQREENEARVKLEEIANQSTAKPTATLSKTTENQPSESDVVSSHSLLKQFDSSSVSNEATFDKTQNDNTSLASELSLKSGHLTQGPKLAHRRPQQSASSDLFAEHAIEDQVIPVKTESGTSQNDLDPDVQSRASFTSNLTSEVSILSQILTQLETKSEKKSVLFRNYDSMIPDTSNAAFNEGDHESSMDFSTLLHKEDTSEHEQGSSTASHSVEDQIEQIVNVLGFNPWQENDNGADESRHRLKDSLTLSSERKTPYSSLQNSREFNFVFDEGGDEGYKSPYASKLSMDRSKGELKHIFEEEDEDLIRDPTTNITAGLRSINKTALGFGTRMVKNQTIDPSNPNPKTMYKSTGELKFNLEESNNDETPSKVSKSMNKSMGDFNFDFEEDDLKVLKQKNASPSVLSGSNQNSKSTKNHNIVSSKPSQPTKISMHKSMGELNFELEEDDSWGMDFNVIRGQPPSKSIGDFNFKFEEGELEMFQKKKPQSLPSRETHKFDVVSDGIIVDSEDLNTLGVSTSNTDFKNNAVDPLLHHPKSTNDIVPNQDLSRNVQKDCNTNKSPARTKKSDDDPTQHTRFQTGQCDTILPRSLSSDSLDATTFLTNKGNNDATVDITAAISNIQKPDQTDSKSAKPEDPPEELASSLTTKSSLATAKHLSVDDGKKRRSSNSSQESKPINLSLDSDALGTDHPKSSFNDSDDRVNALSNDSLQEKSSDLEDLQPEKSTAFRGVAKHIPSGIGPNLSRQESKIKTGRLASEFELPKWITASAHKAHADEKIGLVFRNEGPRVIVSKIAPTSPLLGSELKEDCELLAINGHRVKSARRAGEYLLCLCCCFCQLCHRPCREVEI